MKNTGIVRKIDELGRVVLPKEVRVVFCIKVGDPLEFYIDEAEAILAIIPYRPGCYVCGEGEDLIVFKGHKVCRKCCHAARLQEG